MAAKVNTVHFKIREATINDLIPLAKLHIETFNETHGMHPYGPTYELREYQWRTAFQDEDKTWFCFVIENEVDELIGFAKGQPYHQVTILNFQGNSTKYIS